jgi:hypothetical protein
MQQAVVIKSVKLLRRAYKQVLLVVPNALLLHRLPVQVLVALHRA